MNEYPPQSPWGPHGPQVSGSSVTPNPTPPTPYPEFAPPQPWSPPAGPAPGPGDAVPPGGAVPSGGAAASGGIAGRFSDAPIGKRIRNLAIVGVVLGGFAGLLRGLLTHLPPSATGLLALRFGIAGALAGAGIPPAVRAVVLAARAAIWIALAIVLWVIAIVLIGQSGWLTRWR